MHVYIGLIIALVPLAMFVLRMIERDKERGDEEKWQRAKKHMLDKAEKKQKTYDHEWPDDD